MGLETLRALLEASYASESPPCAKSAESAVSPGKGQKDDLNELIALNAQGSSLGQLRLMERLRTGQVWLAEVNATLEAEDAVDTPLNERLAAGFDLFGKMENLLRFTYDYEGCIHGQEQSCPRDAVVLCDACVEVRK